MYGIFKYYSIILISLLMVINLVKMFYSDEGTIRLANFIGFLLYLPIIIYLIGG